MYNWFLKTTPNIEYFSITHQLSRLTQYFKDLCNLFNCSATINRNSATMNRSYATIFYYQTAVTQYSKGLSVIWAFDLDLYRLLLDKY